MTSPMPLENCPFCNSKAEYYNDAPDSVGCSNKGCNFSASVDLETWQTRPQPVMGLDEEAVYKLLSKFHYVDFGYDDGSMQEKMQDGIDNPRDLAKVIVAQFGTKKVKVPDRNNHKTGVGSPTAYSQGWNACIDEVIRLNARTEGV